MEEIAAAMQEKLAAMKNVVPRPMASVPTIVT